MDRIDHDERRPIVLREERLDATTERVRAADASVRIGVASDVWKSDIPVVRETVTISRQTVSHGAADEIEGDRTWIFPLSSERVIVNKRTVVEDDLAIGVRSVTDDVRVSGTVRRETLHVAYDAAEEAR